MSENWFTRDGTGEPSDLIQGNALTPPTFNGTAVTIDEVFDLTEFDAATPRVHVGYGESLTGAAGDVAELFVGGAGAETIQGGGGADLVVTGGGADTVDAGLGDDIVAGGSGDDVLSGGNGSDVLVGGAGIDELEGGLGNNVLIGDEGADTFVIDPTAGGEGVNVVWGSAGSDTFSFTGNSQVTLVDVSQPNLDEFLSLDFSALPYDGTIIVNPEQGDRLLWNGNLVEGASYGLTEASSFSTEYSFMQEAGSLRYVVDGSLSGDGPQSPIPIPEGIYYVRMPDAWELTEHRSDVFGYVDESDLFYQPLEGRLEIATESFNAGYGSESPFENVRDERFVGAGGRPC